MTDAEQPEIPPIGEETRESGTDRQTAAVEPADRGVSLQNSPSVVAADRLLPPFLLVQEWTPDIYDEVVLDWWGEAYLMECGTLHADARLAEHDHGRILALVVVEEDWVEECIEIAGGKR